MAAHGASATRFSLVANGTFLSLGKRDGMVRQSNIVDEAAELTPRQALFVSEFLVDLNATQAAIRAGYAESGARTEGTRLLAHAGVSAAIAARFKERTDALGLSVDRVLRGLYEEATRTGEGSSHGARVTAWGLIAKHFGMFIERQEVTVTHRFSDLSDQELNYELTALVGRNRQQAAKH